MMGRKVIWGLVLASVVFCGIQTGHACTPPPVAILTAEPNETIIGVTVTFDGNSLYADGDKIITKYEWDFDGDGTYDYYELAPCDGIATYAYTSGGTFTAKLRVTDNRDLTGIDTYPVQVGGIHNLTQGEWYSSIQAAINDAVNSDIIEVSEGTWNEAIDFNGVDCILRSTDPNDYDVVAGTVIDANGGTAAVTFNDGEGSGAVLQGLTLTGGTNGISCSNSSSPTIKQCIIRNNSSYGISSSSSTPPTIKSCIVYDNDKGMGFSGATSAGVVRNNTIVDNTTEGIIVPSGTAPAISNCILWNTADDLDGCIATYSCIKDGDSGTGNISSYPYFEDYSGNDFHLTWNSPCINKGNPNGSYSSEFDIDGDNRVVDEQVDIGADEIHGENLVQNPGFDGGCISNTPLHWSKLEGTDQAIDPSNYHSEPNSWKFTTNNSSSMRAGITDGYISVEPLMVYQLSAWVKCSSGNESLRFGWKTYNTSQSLISTSDFVLQEDTAGTTEWQEYSRSRMTTPNAHYAQVRIIGPYYTTGTVWWDDVQLECIGPEFTPPFGCVNEPDLAETVNFGDGLNEDYVAGTITNYMSIICTDVNDNNIKYRELKDGKTVIIEFPAFNVPESYNPDDPNDPNSFPLTPMLLEIMFKDTIDDIDTSISISSTPVKVRSRLDYINLDPDYKISSQERYYELTRLGGAGDGKWRYVQYGFGVSDYQLLRAVDGKFIIQIVNQYDAHVPIDYVSLRKITEEQYKSLVDRQREARAIYAVELPSDSPADPNYDDPNLVVFTRDIMHPVYRHTKPSINEVDQDITGFSCWGDVEPLSFSLYSESGVNDLSITVSNLVNNSNSSDIISSNNISVYRVVYDEARLGYYSHCSNQQGYALLPDRLEDTNSLSIDANSSESIWIKVKIPNQNEGLEAGLYEGTVTISGYGSSNVVIPIKLTIYDITLDSAKHSNPVHHDPYSKVYANDMDTVFSSYAETGFDPHFGTYLSDAYRIDPYKDGNDIKFDSDNFEAALDKMLDAGFAKDKVVRDVRYDVRELYNLATGDTIPENFDDPNIYFKLSDPCFVDEFKSLIYEYHDIAIADARNITFIFWVWDEPGNRPVPRIVCDRLFNIIHSAGGVTTAAYYTTCDSLLHIDPNKYKLPDACDCNLSPLTDRVDYKTWALSYVGEGYEAHNEPGYYGYFGYYTTGPSHWRNPVYNRFLHGLFAFRTEAEMVIPYAMGDYVSDPFNDFDGAPTHIPPFTYPDFLYAYPTWSGELLYRIGGLEAIREGIKDARYIATLQNILNDPNTNWSDPKVVNANDYLSNLHNRIDPDYKSAYSSQNTELGYYKAILEDISESSDPNDFEAFTEIRKNIADYIVAIDPN